MSNSGSNQSFAAIDLGSNSFHMVIAEPEGNSIRIIDSLRMPTRLGAGLDKQNGLTPETQKDALVALAKFAERLRGIPKKQVRIVGTNTLRRASNAKKFMAKAEELLGKRIDIISGREEARLIYNAVSHAQPDAEKQRLVIDIGGGSTEFALGKGYRPTLVESLNMGCVSYTGRFLGNGKITTEKLKQAIIETQLELQPIEKAYREAGWHAVIGCSGTIKSTASMLAELGLTDGTITRDSLKKLIKLLADAGSAEALKLDSINQNRSQVIAAGVAIVFGIMKSFDINTLHASTVALREGLIFDMLGKTEHIDIQSQTLNNLTSRYSIDVQHAARVENTAAKLFNHVKEPWELDTDSDLELLSWAAKLHELGMGVAHTQYHKHGAYILENSDLLGFTHAEQTALALLVRYHRRKIELQAFDGLPDKERDRLLRLLSLLRLATLLHRGRHVQSLDEISVRIKEGQITIIAPQTWLDEHPLTTAELNTEAERLLHVNIKLKAIEALSL
ncbi:MAG: Ppx/GppA phosphatase family protein [Granulosicoccus sp.]